MSRRVFFILMSLAVSAACSTAQAVTLAPSQDSFGYQFLSSVNLSSPPFGAWLPAGATTTGHDVKSAIQFDLSSVGLSSAQVQSATLQLWVIDSTVTGFGASPSAGSPVLVDLFALNAGWTESTLTWANFPGSGGQYSSASISGINQLVSFDVTSLVKDWLDGAVANNGLGLAANAPVGTSPNWVIPVFSSVSGTLAPALVITPVPEPATIVLGLCALPLLGWQARRRARSRRAG